MAKYIKALNEKKPLTEKQRKEAAAMFLSPYEYRWYIAIRKEGARGVAWGCLPTGTWKRLVTLGLIQGTPFEVWAKGMR